MATLFTLGHSTRSPDVFRQLLKAHGVQRLVDIRRFPGSRRFPHFSADALATSLGEMGIEYVHDADLGGRRSPQPDSPNLFWRNANFRGYADYMSSESFQAAIDRLAEQAAQRTTMIMCAEAVPWRCHRRLIADALVVRGLEVVHLIDAQRSESHVLNPAAKVQPGGVLTYPAAPEVHQSPDVHQSPEVHQSAV